MPSAFLSPYTDLIAQVGGIALAALVVTYWFRRPGTHRFAESVAVVTVLVVGAAAVSALWLNLERADVTRASSGGAPPGVRYTEKCLADQSRLDWVGYSRWLRTVMPEDAIFTGVSDPCLVFQLLPRLPARPGQDASWTLFPEGLPADLLARARTEANLPVQQRTVFVAPDSPLGAVRAAEGEGP